MEIKYTYYIGSRLGREKFDIDIDKFIPELHDVIKKLEAVAYNEIIKNRPDLEYTEIDIDIDNINFET